MAMYMHDRVANGDCTWPHSSVHSKGRYPSLARVVFFSQVTYGKIHGHHSCKCILWGYIIYKLIQAQLQMKTTPIFVIS